MQPLRGDVFLIRWNARFDAREIYGGINPLAVRLANRVSIIQRTARKVLYQRETTARFAIHVKIIQTLSRTREKERERERLARASTSAANIIFCNRKRDRKRITSIARAGATRCNAPSRLSLPYISIIVHLNVPKQKIRKIQYYRIGAFRAYRKYEKHISAPTHANFIVLPACASKNSLSRITAAKCTVSNSNYSACCAHASFSPLSSRSARLCLGRH